MNIDHKRIKILEALLDRPGKSWSVSELSEVSGVSQPTTSRIIGEFEDDNVVSSRRKGNMKLVELERREYVKNLVQAVSEKYRPMVEAAEKFSQKVSNIEEVEKVVLFGSVARGTADFESDIDVLVEVSDTEVRDRIMVKAESVSDDTGFHVSPTVVESETYEEHRTEKSQFYKSIERDKEILYGKKSS